MKASSGAITFKELREMPFAQLSLLARVAKATQIEDEMRFIGGVATGTSGNAKHMDSLEFRYNQLLFIKPTTDRNKLLQIKERMKKKQQKTVGSKRRGK